jgi:hypothetical protein
MKLSNAICGQYDKARTICRPRWVALTLAFITAALFVPASAQAPQPSQTPQTPNADLRVYGVRVVKTPPLGKQFTGYGVYLGAGKVLTAAHVVGNWTAITRPRVQVADFDLPAKVDKIGSSDSIDLALLSVDEWQLPVSLGLRRNPLCKVSPPPNVAAVVVYPERTEMTHTLSPLFIAPKYRAKFSSLIIEPQSSGSGVFLQDHQCLLGIISMKIPKFVYHRQSGRMLASKAGWAGYYVPADTIRAFLPPELRF